MTDEVKIVLVGGGSYGYLYTKWIAEYKGKKKATLMGIVDPYIDKSVHRESIKKLGIPFFDSLEEFYARHKADLAIIATPINLHCRQSLCALANGSHVLCEKPAAGSLADVEKMQKAQDEYNKMLAIGFQWSYNHVIHSIKKDILNGLYGKTLMMKTLVLWPRSLSYFARSWTGKRYAKDGSPIMDSVTSNATAHYLHNLLFLCGDSINEAAGIKSVESYLYKANEVETFDTAEIKVITSNGTPVYYYASHCTKELNGPLFEVMFENGKIAYDGVTAVGRFNNGEEKHYGVIDDPSAGLRWLLQSVETGQTNLPCDIRTAYPHAQVMEQVNADLDKATVFPESVRRKHTIDQETFIYVEGLDGIITDHYEKNSFEKITL